jgi:hypothetical protein
MGRQWGVLRAFDWLRMGWPSCLLRHLLRQRLRRAGRLRRPGGLSVPGGLRAFSMADHWLAELGLSVPGGFALLIGCAWASAIGPFFAKATMGEIPPLLGLRVLASRLAWGKRQQAAAVQGSGLRFSIFNLQSSIFAPRSTLHDLRSTIYNLQSTIYNLQSTIRLSCLRFRGRQTKTAIVLPSRGV